jgi:hypothetical protein
MANDCVMGALFSIATSILHSASTIASGTSAHGLGPGSLHMPIGVAGVPAVGMLAAPLAPAVFIGVAPAVPMLPPVGCVGGLCVPPIGSAGVPPVLGAPPVMIC